MTMNTHKILLAAFAAILPLPAFAAQNAADELSLAGTWQVSLQAPSAATAGAAAAWRDIRLPGTLDDAGIGEPLAKQPALTQQVLTRLQRKHTYIGPAWYKREVAIPEAWRGKQIVLELERVLWESRVFVDGAEISRADSLTTPHRHDLSAALKPGAHELMLRIDNSEIHPGLSRFFGKHKDPLDGPLAHAYTNHTQTMWNGAIGTLRLLAREHDALRTVSVYPRVTPDFGMKIRVGGASCSLPREQDAPPTFDLTLRDAAGAQIAATTKTFHPGTDGVALETEWNLPAGSVQPWSEFEPHLYTFEMRSSSSGAVVSARFGFREVTTRGHELHINGQRVFLRGTLECCVFPLTGHPAMTVAEWKKIITTAKQWGLNHFRFHSWCPPEAAFQAADELGFYLQAELPQWSGEVGKDKKSWDYLTEEASRILAAYGNHPSFVLMTLGNELRGDVNLMNNLVAELRAKDPRRLYATASSIGKTSAIRVPQPQDQFVVTQYTSDGWVRGTAAWNEARQQKASDAPKPPSFDGDYHEAAKNINMPLISHEIGQFCVYPNLAEIQKYTGNLVPLNFIAAQNDLRAKGLLHLAAQYTRATGKFAALLYKEEIEAALRTSRFSGFQLLGLQDFPGQGTALVGMLDAFWEEKGFIKPAEFREFCSETVPLALLPKAVYERGETVRAPVKISNYGKDIKSATIRWRMFEDGGNAGRHGSAGVPPASEPAGGTPALPCPVASGAFAPLDIPAGGLADCGQIEIPIPTAGPAGRWRLEISIDGTPWRNHWNLWVYPRETAPIPEDVVFATTLAEAQAALSAGKKVLFNPPVNQIEGIKGIFVPVFWSPVHFPGQPGTMGILCDPRHPALKDFPTDAHSNWQWWDLASRSKPVRIDKLPVTPIVRVIDNFARNQSLATIFETRVGPGRLLFCAIDLTTDLPARPAARQLRASLLNYMAGDSFAPATDLPPAALDGILPDNFNANHD